eukprot:8079736-Lingulodinium_polyedra.AAC.1
MVAYVQHSLLYFAINIFIQFRPVLFVFRSDSEVFRSRSAYSVCHCPVPEYNSTATRAVCG